MRVAHRLLETLETPGGRRPVGCRAPALSAPSIVTCPHAPPVEFDSGGAAVGADDVVTGADVTEGAWLDEDDDPDPDDPDEPDPDEPEPDDEPLVGVDGVDGVVGFDVGGAEGVVGFDVGGADGVVGFDVGGFEVVGVDGEVDVDVGVGAVGDGDAEGDGVDGDGVGVGVDGEGEGVAVEGDGDGVGVTVPGFAVVVPGVAGRIGAAGTSSAVVLVPFTIVGKSGRPVGPARVGAAVVVELDGAADVPGVPASEREESPPPSTAAPPGSVDSAVSLGSLAMTMD